MIVQTVIQEKKMIKLKNILNYNPSLKPKILNNKTFQIVIKNK